MFNERFLTKVALCIKRENIITKNFPKASHGQQNFSETNCQNEQEAVLSSNQWKRFAHSAAFNRKKRNFSHQEQTFEKLGLKIVFLAQFYCA